MKYLDLTLPAPALNLACDEALLDWCEAGEEGEILRVWESAVPFVVIGYANRVAREVHAEICGRAGIPILRRCTGGGTVVQGPGCVNYALVLRVGETGPLASITGTNQHVMERQRQLVQALLKTEVAIRGHTDLALGGQKFSGNAQRRRRQFLLFHGTFLVRFDLRLIEQLLPMPSKEPFYRAQRAHRSFLANIPVSSSELKLALRNAWAASDPLSTWPAKAVERLATDKYARDDWNCRF